MGNIYSESWAYYTRSFLVILILCALLEGLGFFFDGSGSTTASFIGYMFVFYYVHRDLLLGETNLALKGGLFGRKGKADNKGLFKFNVIALVMVGLTFAMLLGLVFAITGAGIEREVGMVIILPMSLPAFCVSLALLGPMLAAAVVQDRDLTLRRSMSKFGRALWQMLLGPIPLGFVILVVVLAVGIGVVGQLDDDQIGIYAVISSTLSTAIYFFPIIMAVRVTCGIYRELRPAPMEDVFA